MGTVRTCLARLVGLALAALCSTPPVQAKGPTLDFLFPAGAQRGQSLEVTAGGSFESWPVHCWVEGSGVAVCAAQEKGKLTISVAPDARLGVCWLRLYDEEGASAPRPFVIGTLPEVVETEPNDDLTSLVPLDRSRLTVNGRLAKTGEVDCFALKLVAGETLVASMDAYRHLGSPIDGVLQVVSPEGFVLDQNDDEHELDPQVIFHVPRDGTYVVRTFAFPASPNSSIAFAGGEAFIYRLTLTTGGFIDHCYPLAVSGCQSSKVEVIGWNIPEPACKLEVASSATSDSIQLDHTALANTSEVLRVPHPALVEQEPNDAKNPQPIPVPVTITGRIDPERDRDVFQFTAKKGQPLVIRVESRSLGQPLDPSVRVSDKEGKTLAEVDDSGRNRDPELSFSPPKDDEYRVEVRDLHGHGGLRFVYRLSITAPQPDFRMTLKNDQFTLTPGKPLEVPVAIERKNQFSSPIELSVAELPEGVCAPLVRSEPAGATANSVKLLLTASAGPARSGAIRIVGTAKGDLHLARTAQAPVAGVNAVTSHVWLTVLKSEATRSEEKSQ